MNFASHKPVKMITGWDCVRENYNIFRELGRHAIVVSGKNSADKCGAMEDVAYALEMAGCTFVRYNVIPENPPAPLCHEGGRLAREEKCDFVVAIGGGSAIDAAKAIAAYATNPQCDVEDIFDDAIRTSDSLPLVAIPTTAGTGTEACRYSVLTIDGGRRKRTFKSSTSYAKYSLICPKYTLTLSENYTVSTALDALAHAIESYLSPKSNEVSEEAALYAAGEIWDVIFNGNGAGKFGFTEAARERLMYAATAAGIAIDYTGTGFPHPLGYSITLTRGIPHGRACAIFEGAYLSYNMKIECGREKIEKLDAHLACFEEIMARPYVQGSDLIAAGVEPGPLMGEVLEYGHKLRLAGMSKENQLRQCLGYWRTLQ
jgi:alcohol dehydrogenase class IV